MKAHLFKWWFGVAIVLAVLSLSDVVQAQKAVTLLNVSYDPTRELFQEHNAAFAKYWKARTGAAVTIKQSRAGSGSPARAVIAGLPADVVTRALTYGLDGIANANLTPKTWQSRLPNN